VKRRRTFHDDIFRVPQRLRLGRPAFVSHSQRLQQAFPMQRFYYVYILVSESDGGRTLSRRSPGEGGRFSVLQHERSELRIGKLARAATRLAARAIISERLRRSSQPDNPLLHRCRPCSGLYRNEIRYFPHRLRYRRRCEQRPH
jgi:hypothetical protein